MRQTQHQQPHSNQNQELRIHVSSKEQSACWKRGRRQWASPLNTAIESADLSRASSVLESGHTNHKSPGHQTIIRNQFIYKS